MKSKNFDSLDNVLNTSSEMQVYEEPNCTEIKSIDQSSVDIKKDYEYTRANLYSLIEKGQEAIDGIM